MFQLEEMVCEWQESESLFTNNHWRHENSNWINVLPSAIRFLSDGCVGELFIIGCTAVSIDLNKMKSFSFNAYSIQIFSWPIS